MEQAEKHSTDKAGVGFNDIESEVLRFRRTAAKSGKSADDEEFRRNTFESKRAHRVACLLASSRLIASLSTEPFFSETIPVDKSSKQNLVEDCSG
eukprot:1888905-Rhodomonas_salina.3